MSHISQVFGGPNEAFPLPPNGQGMHKKYDSKVKGLLYGGDDRPLTPKHEGRRSKWLNATDFPSSDNKPTSTVTVASYGRQQESF